MEAKKKKGVKANQETVFKACEELLANRTYPTQAKILELLGGGSPNSVAKYQKEWIDEQQQNGRDITNTECPKSKSTDSLMNQLHAAIYADVERLVVDERLAAITKINEELESEVERLEDELVGYQEMKGKIEGYEQNQNQLMATIQNQVKQQQMLQKEMEEIKDFMNVVNERSQNK